MQYRFLNPLLPLLILTPLHFFFNVSALALPEQQQDSESAQGFQVKFSTTASSSGTTSSHSLELYPDSDRMEASLNGVISFPKGTRIQKAWVTSGPSARVRCEIGTVPYQPGKHMFYGDGNEKVEEEAWEGDVEATFVHCEIPTPKTVIV